VPAPSLEEEIESWKGFPWALRKEDRELWDAMIKEVRVENVHAVEQSRKDSTVDTFFMSLILAQQKKIKLLEAEIKTLKEKRPS
jgi:hypothetical protein